MTCVAWVTENDIICVINFVGKEPNHLVYEAAILFCLRSISVEKEFPLFAYVLHT